jgi:hypothetical protein
MRGLLSIIALLLSTGVWLLGRNCFISGIDIVPTDLVCQWSCSDLIVREKAPWYKCAGESMKVRSYRVAAEQGDARAQFNLAVSYDFGNGVTEGWREEHGN